MGRRVASAAPTSPGAADILRASGLFDADWYRDANPDIAATGVDPVDHYLASGAEEGRKPNAVFDSAWYLSANADVRQARINPLLHYVVSGAAQGRSAGPDFDTAYYIARYPEIETAGINPLLHYLQFGRQEGRTATPFDEGEAFEVGVRARQQGLSGPASALYRGERGDHVHFALTGRGKGRVPLPPLQLAQRTGSLTLEDFDNTGSEIRNTIVRALPGSFTWAGSRCLDFGSGVGRVLRHFGDQAEQAEFWGCDMDGSSIRWSVQNLSPPFRFFQMADTPTLPFEDNSFDLVYAISVLSHVPMTWHQWMMEIRRILKPGGTFFLSFMGQTPMEEMLGQPYWTRSSDFGMYVKRPHQAFKDGSPTIFVSPEWIKTFWGSLFDIDYIAMDGLLEYDSFCVMRKPLPTSLPRCSGRLLQLSTAQPFNPDAVGRIQPQFDGSTPYLESYGLDVEPRRATLIQGWIVFRGDRPESIETSVDGHDVASEVRFEEGNPYRDWKDTPVMAFTLTVDLSGLKRGVFRFAARIISRDGMKHTLTIPMIIR